jgi:hypothetical protein
MSGGRMMVSPRKIPQNVNPAGKRCITFEIPDDDEWERIAWSTLYDQLALVWMNWERTGDDTGSRLCRRWREILRTWKHCDGTRLKLVEDYEDMVKFTEDCDCNLSYVCCDGTEHPIAFKSDVPAPHEVPENAPQPKPGGGNQEYCLQFAANNKLLVPTIVNSGDKVELTKASGAGNDGGHTTWYCHDGSIYFAGACVGTGGPTSGDPMPSEWHMSLIVDIGGTFYSLEHGAFTVPGGVTNAQLVVQVNDSDISNNAGSYQACIKVTNNKPVTTCTTTDFALTPDGWTENTPGYGGVWGAGAGWGSVDVDTIVGGWQRTIYIKKAVSGNVTKITLQYNLVIGSYGFSTDEPIIILINGSPVAFTDAGHAATGNGQVLVATGSWSNPTIGLIVSSSINYSGPVYSGSCEITAVVICE